MEPFAWKILSPLLFAFSLFSALPFGWFVRAFQIFWGGLRFMSGNGEKARAQIDAHSHQEKNGGRKRPFALSHEGAFTRRCALYDVRDFSPPTLTICARNFPPTLARSETEHFRMSRSLPLYEGHSDENRTEAVNQSKINIFDLFKRLN